METKYYGLTSISDGWVQEAGSTLDFSRGALYPPYLLLYYDITANMLDESADPPKDKGNTNKVLFIFYYHKITRLYH